MGDVFATPTSKMPIFGSIYYYSYRKLKDKEKSLLYALDQIKHQLIQTIEFYTEKHIADQKLNWWLGEINTLTSDSKCQSPQLKLLSTHIENEHLHSTLMNDIHYAYQTMHDDENTKDIHTHCEKRFVGIEQLKAYILNKDSINTDTIKQINYSNEILRHIYFLARHYSHNIIFDNNINPNINKEEYHKIVKPWLKQAKESALKARMGKHKNLDALFCYNKIYYKLVEKTLKKIESPFKQKMIFSPLTLLFYSRNPKKL